MASKWGLSKGITPEGIDIVILTRGHPEHMGGNIDSENKPPFPNARYVMWKGEWDFWISEPNLSELNVDEDLKELLVTFAIKHLTLIEHQFNLVDHEGNVVASVSLVRRSFRTTNKRIPALARFIKEVTRVISKSLGCKSATQKGPFRKRTRKNRDMRQKRHDFTKLHWRTLPLSR